MIIEYHKILIGSEKLSENPNDNNSAIIINDPNVFKFNEFFLTNPLKNCYHKKRRSYITENKYKI